MKMKYDELFDRELIRYFEEKIAELELNHSQFARRIFPETANPKGKWDRIRKVSKGKPQPITIPEAIRAASVCGKSLPTVMWEVENRLKALGIKSEF